MGVGWSDSIDDVIAGDAAAGLAYMTPAGGVVITPMAPLGLRDREAGTVTVTTSLGLWKKVERIKADPSVAIAYHAREHGFSNRPEFVLAQGRATIPAAPDRRWLDSIKGQWERFLGPLGKGLTERLLEVYYYERVPITVDVERILVWPDERCEGSPEVIGAALPAAAPPQAAPGKGTGPRLDPGKVAADCARLPHALVGWRGGDGLPIVATARVRSSTPEGIELELPSASEEGTSLPIGLTAGGRRAGLTAHSFQQHMVGQEQRIHTGWLEVEDGRCIYAPHTRAGYAMPRSKPLFVLGAAVATRRGIREARRRGLA